LKNNALNVTYRCNLASFIFANHNHHPEMNNYQAGYVDYMLIGC